MIETEMELVRRLGDVEPLPDDAFGQARSVLQAAIAGEAGPQVVELSDHPKRRRRTLALHGGIAAGVAAAAAAVALVLACRDTRPRFRRARRPRATSRRPWSTWPTT
jgi:acyl-coenzyme A thioesterase PaaI-like protein